MYKALENVDKDSAIKIISYMLSSINHGYLLNTEYYYLNEKELEIEKNLRDEIDFDNLCKDKMATVSNELYDYIVDITKNTDTNILTGTRLLDQLRACSQ